MKRLAYSMALFAACSLLAAEGGRPGPIIRGTRGGGLDFSDPELTLAFRIVFKNWTGQVYATGAVFPEHETYRELTFKNAKNAAAAKATGRFGLKPDGEGGADIDYGFVFPERLAVEQIGLQGNLPLRFSGNLVADGVNITLDADGKGLPWYGKVSNAELISSGGSALAFKFTRPVDLWVMRASGALPRICLRIAFVGKKEIEAGGTVTAKFSIRGRTPLIVESGMPIRREAGPDWIPFMPDADIFAGSACDYSGLRGTVEKCGTYGRVVAKGGHFEFEGLPGVAQRFYGANVCFDACYMEPQKSDRLVELLCRAGYNSVRLHHFDRKLTEASEDATVPDPERMRRLDHFLAKCYDAGLYVTTDFHVGRMVPRSVIEPGAEGRLGYGDFKKLVFTNELLRVNFKKFISNFMNHVNAETGRRYADEPGLFAIALVNEGAPQLTEEADWRVQAIRLADMETAHAADIRRFLREEVKTPVLISNMSAGWSPSAYQIPRAKVYDYVDIHFYVDHPSFVENRWSAPWQYQNRNPLKDSYGGGLPCIALTRLFEKPFVSTEYNYCAPFAYRMLGSLLTGSAAALQDWAGVWRFLWTNDPRGAVTLDFHEPFHGVGFNTPGDPLQLVGEGLFAALFLRGDLTPHPTSLAVRLDEDTIRKGGSKEPKDLREIDWIWAGWRTRIGTTFAPAPQPGDSVRGPEAFGFDAKRIGECAPVRPCVQADSAAGTFAVSTPKSAALFADGGRMKAGALEADIKFAPAAVWILSLDGKPLSETKRVQLVHLTDCQSTDMKLIPGRPLVVFNHGRLPFLMRRGRADVTLSLANAHDWKIYALSPGGRRLREVKGVMSGGRLKLVCDTAADPNRATYIYEITRR